MPLIGESYILYQVVALACVMMIAACSRPPEPGEVVLPGPFAGVHLASTDLWSGGEVNVISSSFKSLAALPVVQLNGAAISVRRLDDSTIAGRLPEANATFAVHVQSDSFLPFDGSVTVHGFEQSRAGPVMSGALQVVAGQPVVLGAGAVGLVELNARTNTVQRQYPDSVHSTDCVQGVGPSIVPGRFVFFGTTAGSSGTAACTTASAWTYGTTPSRTAALTGAAPGVWAVAEIGPGGVISGNNNSLTISHCTAGVCTTGLPLCISCAGSLTGVTIGTIAQRAVLHSFNHLVVNTQTGDTLYRLPFPASLHVEGAAFSPTEDTVYVAGGDSLIMAGSANGAVYRTLTLAGLQVVGVGRDELRPWIYLAVLGAGNVLQLLVIERGSLATIATLRAPAVGGMPTVTWQQFRVVPDPVGTHVYVVATVQAQSVHDATSRILSFGVTFP